MKKYLIFLLIPFLCGFSPHEKVIARKNAIVSYCVDGSGTWVGNPGDTEQFEYQEDDFCTTEFSVADNDGIISTYDVTQYKNGGHSASFAVSGTQTDSDNFVQVDLGAGDGTFTDAFWFWCPDNTVDSELWPFASVTTGADHTDQGTKGYRLTARHQATGFWKLNADGAADDQSVQIPTEEFLLITVDYIQDNAGCTVTIHNEALTLLDTLTFTSPDKAPRYLTFGGFDDEHATDTFYVDDWQINTDGGGM